MQGHGRVVVRHCHCEDDRAVALDESGTGKTRADIQALIVTVEVGAIGRPSAHQGIRTIEIRHLNDVDMLDVDLFVDDGQRYRHRARVQPPVGPEKGVDARDHLPPAARADRQVGEPTARFESDAQLSVDREQDSVIFLTRTDVKGGIKICAMCGSIDGVAPDTA